LGNDAPAQQTVDDTRADDFEKLIGRPVTPLNRALTQIVLETDETNR